MSSSANLTLKNEWKEEEMWITGVVPAKKPPMLKSEKLAKEILRNQYSRARELHCISTSLLDFIAIYIYIYARTHRCLLLAVGEALMVTLFSPCNAFAGR